MKIKSTIVGRLIIVIFILASSFTPIAFIGRPTVAKTQQQDKSRQLVQEHPTGSSVQSLRRIALVIGNANYQYVPMLTNPVNDARDMADALRRLGFEVLNGENLGAEQMKRYIHQFGEKLNQGGGVGLFYYAGHGVQIGGRNYMIPVEASNLRESTIEFEAVDVNRVLGEMDAAGNRLNIIILDACRNNPFKRNWRSTVGDGLAPLDAPAGTLIAYATKPNDVASDGTGRNGLYTQELLREMFVPGLSIEDVLKRVRISVQQKTNKRQVPWEASSLVGEFRFLDSAASPKTNTPTHNSLAPVFNVLPHKDTGISGGTFHINPNNSVFALKIDLIGKFRVFPNYIEVAIEKAVIQNHGTTNSQLLKINIGLANFIDDKGKWQIASNGEGIPVGKTLTPGGQLNLGSLYYSIPKNKEVNLFKSWLIVEIKSELGHSYAHSSKDVFK